MSTESSRPTHGRLLALPGGRWFTLGVVLAATGVGLFAAATDSRAQFLSRSAEVDAALGKDNAMLRRSLAQEVEAASAATVALYIESEDGPQRAAYATAVTEDGFVVTKASEIDGTVTADVPDGNGGVARVAGRIVGVARDHDLAAVKLTLPRSVRLEPVTFDTGAVSTTDAGSWIVTPDSAVGAPGSTPSPIAIGNLSVTGLRKIAATGLQLGISMGPVGMAGQAGIPIDHVTPGGAADRAGFRPGDLIIARDGEAVGTRQDFLRRLRFDRPGTEFMLTVSRAGQERQLLVRLGRRGLGFRVADEVAGVFVAAVFPGSAAEEAGIVPMDLITAIADTPVRTGEALVEALKRYKSGDRLTVDIVRAGKPMTLNVQVGNTRQSIRAVFQNRLGGSTLSRRAADFPAVLQHDSVLDADEMGGPVVDLQGRVLGINIARAGRVETYALPAQVIDELLPDLMSGRRSAATAPATTEEGQPAPQESLRP